MLLRRITEHVKAQNWTAVGLDFAIVVIGVFIGFQVAEWNEGRKDQMRTQLVLETLREDLRLSTEHESAFSEQVIAGIDAWQNAFDSGERPPPYYFRIPGSDTAPANAWTALLNMRLGESVHPKLVFELAFYYSERDGVAQKYVRYTNFMEARILPQLKGDPADFYLEDGSALKPEYAVYMDNMHLWAREMVVNVEWANCLAENLEAIGHTGATCTPQLLADLTSAASIGSQAKLR